MSWQDGLTPEQVAAAGHCGSHAVVLAGPGTGKTRVICQHILFLIEEGVPPEDILALTFTRKAAAELRRRVQEAIGEDSPQPTIATLHSYGLSTLLRNGGSAELPSPLRIADDWEERWIIQEDLKKLLALQEIGEVQRLFNQLSADWQTLAAAEADWQDRFPNPGFLGHWREHRQVYGYTLRAELVYQLKQLLDEGGPELVGVPKYIIVDEYQDLNPCDLAVIQGLVKSAGGELYAAGDDDQSIYGFRYADPQGIREFGKWYSGAQELELAECKRCARAVIGIAKFVAEQDTQRKAKDWNPEPGAETGRVHVLGFADGAAEARGIARIAQWLVNQCSVPPGEILVLLRQDRHHIFSEPIQKALEALGLAACTAADPLEPINRRPGRDMSARELIAILRLAVNPDDSLALRTLLQVRPCRVGPAIFEKLYAFARDNGLTFSQTIRGHLKETELSNALRRKVEGAVQGIDEEARKAREVIDTAGVDSGLDSLCEQYIQDPDLHARTVWLFKRVLESMPEGPAVEGIELPEEEDELERFLRTLYVSLDEREQERDPGRITIMTMHQAKGLTATAVLVAGAEDEFIPGHNQDGLLDDERRLLYVALTRAKKYLFVTYSLRRAGRQRYSGRSAGAKRRRLTRFLKSAPVKPKDGARFARTLSSGGRQ